VVENRLITEFGDYVQVIAYIQSCLIQCVNAPRQGFLAPATRAK
jgi:hypothetical protein